MSVLQYSDTRSSGDESTNDVADVRADTLSNIVDEVGVIVGLSHESGDDSIDTRAGDFAVILNEVAQFSIGDNASEGLQEFSIGG